MRKWIITRGIITSAVSTLLCFNLSYADVPRDLAYPTGTPNADNIAAQVYFVNHFYAVNNFFIHREGKRHITVLASRDQDGRTQINTLRRFLNNLYKPETGIRSKDMTLFHSGKLRGTGMLITDFEDDGKSQEYVVWLPATKKIRRFAEPPHEDAWGGIDFTFGDVSLRKPKHETHELLGTETMQDCLRAMPLNEQEQADKYLKQLHSSQCAHKGKQVYKLKSTTTFKNWWYDYRISLIDTETYADYRTEYFKDGKLIKFIDRDWVSMRLDDPRGVYWRYWYGKNLLTGHETMISVPDDVVEWNKEDDPSLWTEDMLKNLRN